MKMAPEKSDSRYTLYYRTGDIPLAFTDMIFDSKAYGRFDCRILQHRDVSTVFLTKKGLKELHRTGEELLNDAFRRKIISKTDINSITFLLINP